MNKIELFLSDPRYQQLDQAGKQKALDRFFYKYVPLDSRYQQLDQAGKESVYNTFISKYLGVQTQTVEQPKPQTFRDKLSAKSLGVDINKETAQAVSTGTADTQKAQFFKSDPKAGYEAGKSKAKDIYGNNKIGFIGDLVSGFSAGAKQIFAAPEIWGNYLAGNKYRAQELQGMIDEQLSQAGYNDMDMVGAIKKGDIKAVAGMALRTTAQSAPTTIAWLLRNYAGDVAAFSSASSAKLMQLDREHPELSKGKAIASAINAGFWEAATEEIGNRIVFLNKYVKNLRALPKAVLTKTIAKEIAKTGVKNIAKELGISMAGEGLEEVGTFTAEYIADTLLGIHEFDLKEFALGNLNSGLLGASGGLVQSGAVTGYMSVRSASMLNLKSKLENAANLDLSKYKDAESWNVAKNLKQLAANTKTAVQMAEDGDAEGAAELAYENLSAAQRNLESTGLRSFSGIGSYNAILIDAISDYSTEEEGIDIKENIATRKLANIVNNIAAGQELIQSLKTIKQAVQIAEMSNKKEDIDKAAQALAEIDQTKLNDKDKEVYQGYADTIAKLQQATGEVKKTEKGVVVQAPEEIANDNGKKIWQMTKAEMLQESSKKYLEIHAEQNNSGKVPKEMREMFIEAHKLAIAKALDKGENVPEYVLSEYEEFSDGAATGTEPETPETITVTPVKPKPVTPSPSGAEAKIPKVETPVQPKPVVADKAASEPVAEVKLEKMVEAKPEVKAAIAVNPKIEKAAKGHVRKYGDNYQYVTNKKWIGDKVVLSADGYLSDGKIVYKDASKALIPVEIERKNASAKLDEVFFNSGEYSPVTSMIYGSPDDENNIVITTDAQGRKVRFIERYLDLAFSTMDIDRIEQDGDVKLVFYKGNDIVGGLMGYRIKSKENFDEEEAKRRNSIIERANELVKDVMVTGYNEALKRYVVKVIGAWRINDLIRYLSTEGYTEKISVGGKSYTVLTKEGEALGTKQLSPEPTTKENANDQENQKRVSGEERKGEKPVQTKPVAPQTEPGSTPKEKTKLYKELKRNNERIIRSEITDRLRKKYADEYNALPESEQTEERMQNLKDSFNEEIKAETSKMIMANDEYNKQAIKQNVESFLKNPQQMLDELKSRMPQYSYGELLLMYGIATATHKRHGKGQFVGKGTIGAQTLSNFTVTATIGDQTITKEINSGNDSRQIEDMHAMAVGALVEKIIAPKEAPAPAQTAAEPETPERIKTAEEFKKRYYREPESQFDYDMVDFDPKTYTPTKEDVDSFYTTSDDVTRSRQGLFITAMGNRLKDKIMSKYRGKSVIKVDDDSKAARYVDLALHAKAKIPGALDELVAAYRKEILGVKEVSPQPAAETKVLKKELSDIYNTLSLLKEEHDRLLKIDPDNRTAEQDKRIEYIDELSKVRTIRKSEIEREIAGIKTPPKEAVTPAPAQTAAEPETEDKKPAYVMTLAEYTKQYIDNHAYKDKYKQAKKLNILEKQAQDEWIKSLKEQAQKGRLSDKSIDSYVHAFSAGSLQSVFRGVYAKGIEGWIPADIRNAPKESAKERLQERLNKLERQLLEPDYKVSSKEKAKIRAKIKGIIKALQATEGKVVEKPAAETKITDRQSFQSQWRAAQPKLTQEQLDTQLEIVDALMQTYADEMEITIDEAYATVSKIGTQKLKDSLNQDLMAQIKFRPDGKAEIAFLKPDITSGLHEISHLGRKFLSTLAQHDTTGKWQAVMKDAETWAGVKDGKWTTEAEEKFAKGFEKYLYEGNAPTAKLKTAFEKIKQWIAELIDRIAGIDAIQLDDRIRSVYGMMLGAEKVKAKTAKKSLSDIETKYGFTGKEALRKGIIVANTTITKRGGERVLSYSASNLGMSDFDTMMEAIDAYYTEKARRESLLSEVVLGTMEGKVNYFELFKGDNKLYARVYSANGIVKDYSKTEWESKLWEIQNLVYLGEDRDGNKIGKYSGEQIDKYKYNLPEKYVKYNGMYVDSNIHSVAKQPLTSQPTNKIEDAYYKIKSSASGANSEDMHQLKRDLGLLLMPSVRVQQADDVANYYIAFKDGEILKEKYDAFMDELIAENRTTDATDQERAEAKSRLEAYRKKEAEAQAPTATQKNTGERIKIYISDLVSHYKAIGMDRQRAWREYITDTIISKRIDTQKVNANTFFDYYDTEHYPKKSDKMMPVETKPLTSQHKAAVVKIKADMAGKVGSDPVALEKHLDRYINDKFKNLTMEAENKKGVYSLSITDIDTGNVLVEIAHKDGTYEINEFFAQDNADAITKIEELLASNGKVLNQDYGDSPQEQYDAVKKQYAGTAQWLKAPNGKPSNLNERQWLQVRTPNFKNWFGDWENDPKNASKVVDENGEPMVVYHSTDGNFNIFDITKARSYTGNPDYDLPGFYFTQREEFADDYGTRRISAFLNFKKPFTSELNAYKRQNNLNTWRAVYDKILVEGYDGVIELEGANNSEEEYIALVNTQIKSATGNVGTFSQGTGHILYQMAEGAAPDKQQAVKDQIAAQAKKARKVQATARRLRYKMGSTANVGEWNNFMRQSLTTLIRTMHPGATPINEQWVEALHYQFLDAQARGDEDLMKYLKRKVERMKKADAKFRRYLSHYSGGYEDVAYIPFEQLFIAIQAISPSTYNHLVSGNTPQVILDLIPKLKQEFGDKYMDAVGWLVHYTHLGSSPYTGASEFGKFAMQPHRLLARIMGKAGVELVGLGYQAGIQNRLYEHGYEPFLSRVHKMLLSPENNRGAAYMGEEIDYIGKTIVEVVNDLGIEPEQQKAEIRKRIEEWNAKEESIINVQDVIDIYDASMDLMDLFKDYITEWNANPKHEKAKIGILENYLPRSYRGEDISSVVDKIGDSFLYRSKNAKRREKEELSKNRLMEDNMFILLRNYAYEMSKYMAFYDFAEYATQQITRIDKDRIVKRGSLMDQDISFLQKHTSGSVRDYVRNYIRDTIGYHKAQKGWDRFISSARTNAYSNALSLNLLMTALNWHQRWLIYSVVDRNVADYVRNDIQFWTGNTKMSEQMYPMLSEIMEQYKIHNLSLLADMLAEAKSMQSIGSTKASRAYYEATAFNAKILQTSPFSRAEYGNRAWAHAAGVYQVLMNSPEYKQAMQTQGMTRHGAMEIALQNPQLRDAAIRYGGIINAEVNADVNSSFAPSLFRNSSGIKHILTFMRYSNTILLLKLRTYGGVFRKLKSELSPDIFNLLTSGDAKAVNDAQLIQLAEMMKQFTSSKRADKLIKDGYISRTPGKGLITVDQMRSINEAISWALDTYTGKAKIDHADIVRSTKDKLERAAQLLGFDLAETMIRLLYAFLAGLIPWWMGRKTKIDPEMITLMALQNVLPLRSMSYSLGQGILPDIPVYNMDNPKVISKEITKKGMVITPYFGQINAASKIFTGKYISDIAWDEITEK